MDEAIDIGLPFDLANAPELKLRLQALVETSRVVAIDLRWTEEVDIAGLQLLLVTHATLSSLGGELQLWAGKAFEEAARLSGLAERFEPLLRTPSAEVW